MVREVLHMIGGTQVKGDNPEWHTIYHPVTGEENAKVAYADKKIVDQAVASASVAFNNWSRVTVSRRAKVLFDYKRLVERDHLKIAVNCCMKRDCRKAF